MYVALLRCVTCMSFVSSPHDHRVPSRTLFAVVRRFDLLHKKKSMKRIACSWVMSDAGRTNTCWLLFFLHLHFNSLLCQVHAKILKTLVHPSRKFFPVLNLELATGSIGCCELRLVAKPATKNQRQETSPM